MAEWISVKDRLPKNNDYVLAWSPGWVECVICFYDKYSEYWYTEDHSLPFPSHWMPLPEPPKGE